MKILIINGSPKRRKGDTLQKLNVPMLDEDVYAKICSGDMQP